MFDNVLANVLAAIATSLLLLFFREIVWLVTGLFSDIPMVRGHWATEYTEPDENGTLMSSREGAELRQAGRLVWGEIKGGDASHLEWKVKGHLVGSTLFADFNYKGRLRAGGKGAMVLHVEASESKMCGWSIWRDLHTDRVESSQYTWKRSQ